VQPANNDLMSHLHCQSIFASNTAYTSSVRGRRRETQTDGDVAGAVRLQKLVEMLPDARNPLHDVVGASVARYARRGPPPPLVPAAAATGDSQLRVGEPSPQIARQEAVDRLHVIGAQHPAEVVVQLEVSRRTGRRRLVHRSDDVRTDYTHTHTHNTYRQGDAAK